MIEKVLMDDDDDDNGGDGDRDVGEWRKWVKSNVKSERFRRDFCIG